MKCFIISLSIFLICTSCAPAPVPGAGQYTPGAPLPTFDTNTVPTLRTDVTAIPFESPTPEYPVHDGDEISPGTEPIATGTLDRITELAVWGKGLIRDLRWSPDGSQFVVVTPLNFTVYDAVTLKRTIAAPGFGPPSNLSARAEDRGGVFTMVMSDGGREIDAFPVAAAAQGFSNVSYLPESNTAVVDWGSSLQVYDVASHERIAEFGGVQYRFAEKPGGGYSYRGDHYSAYDVSPDRKTITLGRFDGQIEIKSGEGYAEAKTLTADGPVRFLAVSPDGTKLAAETNGTISIWDVTAGSITGSLADTFLVSDFFYGYHYGTDMGMKLAQHNDTLAYTNQDNVLLLNTLTGTQEQVIHGRDGAMLDLPKGGIYDHPAFQPIMNISFASDGQKMVTALEDRTYVWDVAAQQFLRSMAPVTESRFPVPVTAFSASTNLFLLGAQDRNVVRLYDVERGSETASIKAWNTGSLQYGYDGTHSMTVSPDGKFVFTWSGLEGSASLWEIQTQKRVMTLKIPASEYSKYQPGFYPVVLSSDNTKLIFTYSLTPQKHEAIVYSIPDGKELYKINAYHAAFSPDSSLIAASRGESQISFYDAQTGEHLRKVTGDAADMYGFQVLYFNADGSHLIAVSTNGSVSVWGMQ